MLFIQKIRFFLKQQISRVQVFFSVFLWQQRTCKLKAAVTFYRNQLLFFLCSFFSSPAVMLSRVVPVAGVTAHKISKQITFFASDVAGTPTASFSPGHPKPILLLLPWLGSRPQAIAKYCEIYFRTGFDVLVVESEVSQFLWPRWGLEYGGRLLELLESERFSQRPLLVHAFSIGGYTFSQVLVHVAKDTQRYQGLTNRIRGHIYDSLVMGSLEHMATGMYRDCCVKYVYLYTFQSVLLTLWRGWDEQNLASWYDYFYIMYRYLCCTTKS